MASTPAFPGRLKMNDAFSVFVCLPNWVRSSIPLGGGEHIFNPSTQEAETGGPTWSTEQVPGQAPKLQENPVSKKLNR
ncbi:hypothetical protein LEMLEM_LOCUS13677 [Lemmus lemmus]